MASSYDDSKKVLFILPSLGDGGSETSLLNVLRVFEKNGHSIELIIEKQTVAETQDQGEHLMLPDGVKVHHLHDKFMGKSGSKFLRKYALLRLIRQLDVKVAGYDLILSNYVTSNAFVERYFPDKVYYWVHFDFSSQMRKNYEISRRKGDRFKKKLKAYFNNKNLIFVSKGASDFLLSLTGFKARTATVIHNMFDIDRIQNAACEEQNKIPPEPYIIHIARLDIFQKRQDLLFEAFKHIDSRYKLVLLTRSSLELDAMIRNAGLSDRVIVADYQKNPYPWIKKARLLVLCSDYEGLPMSIIESLICHTEVVSTDCPSGPAEILSGALSNNLVPCNDAQAFANKVNEVLANPAPKSSFDDYIQRFSQDTIFPHYLNLIGNEEDSL
ncbi:glycosyltransferase [Agarilytica rhodophyticola]|uniref:glycosyltransferase n=1 Tax=Agarilytica rhodophyticola TaxID=1737490 RepID=UPI000B341D31|nr:glycosyltransferase [Agarilytica rhodophyticola]